MMPEAELRELHGRMVKTLTWAARSGIPGRELKELALAKIQLEWILGMETKSAAGWAAALFKALVNLEGLQRTYQRAEQARNQ